MVLSPILYSHVIYTKLILQDLIYNNQRIYSNILLKLRCVHGFTGQNVPVVLKICYWTGYCLFFFWEKRICHCKCTLMNKQNTCSTIHNVALVVMIYIYCCIIKYGLFFNNTTLKENVICVCVLWIRNWFQHDWNILHCPYLWMEGAGDFVEETIPSPLNHCLYL